MGVFVDRFVPAQRSTVSLFRFVFASFSSTPRSLSQWAAPLLQRGAPLWFCIYQLPHLLCRPP
jgi:hypothetical protein